MASSCGTSDDTDATIFEELGFASNPSVQDDEAHQAGHDAAAAERSDRVAACMRESGFPVVDDTGQEPVVDFQGLQSGTVEFAERFGYGFFPRFDELILTHPDARAGEADAYFDQLTEDEQLAYNVALYGDASGGGCIAEAKVDTDEQARLRQAIADELFPAYLAFRERVDADDELADYDADWAVCMAGKGFGYESSPKARLRFETEFFAFWHTAVFPTSQLSSDELRSLSEEERDALYRAGPTVDQAVKETMTREEIDTAIADAECQAKLGSRYEIYYNVLGRYEAEFRAAHADQLDRLG